MEIKPGKKLLVISRASYRIENNKIFFQYLDGPYLDKISSNFSKTTIISGKIQNNRISNLTYRFEKKINIRNIYSYNTNPVSLIKLLIKEIRKCDVVFIFMPIWRSFLSGCLAKCLNKQLIYYSGNPWNEAILSKFGNKFNWIFRFLINVIFDLLDGFLIRISDMRLFNNNQMYKKYGFLPFTEKTKPIVKIEKEDFFYRSDTCKRQKINIVSVGHVMPRKGYEYLIEGFSELVNRGPANKTFELYIVGNNTYHHVYQRKLEKLVIDLSVGKYIQFCGEIASKDEYLDLLREMDIFILSSLSEGFPRVLWEAMSQSLPIIASDLWNIRQEIAAFPGSIYLAKPGDVENITAALLSLAKNQSIRKEMLERQRQYLEKIFAETAEQQFTRLFLRSTNWSGAEVV